MPKELYYEAMDRRDEENREFRDKLFKEMNMSNVYVGLDIGSKGAIAVIDTESTLLELIDYSPNLADDLTQIKAKYTVKMIVVEKVSAMRGQGVTSMFSFGMKVGEIHGILNTLGLPYVEVLPREWMKGLGLPKDKKARKLKIAEIASRMFPSAEIYGSRGGLKDGRSDALMIAAYCRKEYR